MSTTIAYATFVLGKTIKELSGPSRLFSSMCSTCKQGDRKSSHI
jgi:hypothetical protein